MKFLQHTRHLHRLSGRTLVNDDRIMAPCKSTFNEGQIYGNYFDAYINEFWNKYSNETLVFQCDAGTFRGRVNGDHMTFTKDGDGGTYTVYKPTTQDVLEGKGNFNRGNSTELVIEAQLCAAFNRGCGYRPCKLPESKCILLRTALIIITQHSYISIQ